MIPAIPRYLLNMFATLHPRSGDDGYGNPTYGTAINLTHILIEPSRNVNATTLGEQKNYDMVLYFDCANSLPLGQTFTDKDKVVFGGVDYNVRSARPLYNPLTGALHHWEVRLVGS